MYTALFAMLCARPHSSDNSSQWQRPQFTSIELELIWFEHSRHKTYTHSQRQQYRNASVELHSFVLNAHFMHHFTLNLFSIQSYTHVDIFFIFICVILYTWKHAFLYKRPNATKYYFSYVNAHTRSMNIIKNWISSGFSLIFHENLNNINVFMPTKVENTEW